MRLFYKLMVILIPFFAIVILFAHLTNNNVTFVGYIERLTSADFTIVDNAKDAMNTLIDNITSIGSDSFDFSSILNLFGSVLALPFVFIYYLGTVLIALIGMVFLFIPL